MKPFRQVASLACALAALIFVGQPLAMGTPPQKPAKLATASDANAVMLKADAMRQSAQAGASVLAQIDKGVRVRLLRSQDGWSQISESGRTGWVRVLSVRGDAREAIELSDLGDLGKKPQGKVVAVAGVRGLSEENLKAATYAAAEIERLQGYACGRAEAEQFAQAAALQARAMAYLAEPQ